MGLRIHKEPTRHIVHGDILMREKRFWLVAFSASFLFGFVLAAIVGTFV